MFLECIKGRAFPFKLSGRLFHLLEAETLIKHLSPTDNTFLQMVRRLLTDIACSIHDLTFGMHANYLLKWQLTVLINHSILSSPGAMLHSNEIRFSPLRCTHDAFIISSTRKKKSNWGAFLPLISQLGHCFRPKKKLLCCPLPTDRKMRKNRVVFFFFFFFFVYWKCQIWAKNLLKFVFNGLKKHLYCIPAEFSPFRNFKKNIGKLNSLTVRKKKKKIDRPTQFSKFGRVRAT